MATVDKTISARVSALKAQNAARDERFKDVINVRSGNLDDVAPGLLNDDWPKATIANFINTSATDIAEAMGQLPTLACSAGAMKTGRDKERAGKKNKIGAYYWHCSQLEQKLPAGADQYSTFSFLPFTVEPDFKKQTPVIKLVNPVGCYYLNDYWGRTKVLVRTMRNTALQLSFMFPECRDQLLTDPDGREYQDNNEKLDVIKYEDDKHCVLYVPARRDCVLADYPQKMDYLPAVVVERPSLMGKPHGQYDDLVWVQIARAKFALLMLSAADKSINAPTKIPDSVLELPTGPDATITGPAQDLAAVGKVPLQVPTEVFSMQAQLQQELEVGARYPNARTGTPNASVITGRGVEALGATMSSMIATGQRILGFGLERTTSMCFEMDQKFWPRTQKTIEGTLVGESYRISYVPERDIDGSYECNVSYGFATGQSTANAIVGVLQMQGGGLLSRDTAMRAIPMGVDPEEETRKLKMEKVDEAALSGIQQMAASLPAIAQQDPAMAQQTLRALGVISKGIRNGKSLDELLEKAFAPPEAPPTAELPAEPGLAPEGAEAPVGPSAGPEAQPPPPDLMQLVSSLTRGKPQMSTSVRRQEAI